MLDTCREVHTPEGVALRLPAAGPVPRALAWGIDLAIRLAVLLACSAVFGLLGGAGLGLYLVAMFAVLWLYPIVCESLMDGQTPGKRALGLRVISADGAPVGWLATIVRNLLRTVDMLPFGYAAGLASSLADPWGRRLGDLVAGTMVVHAPKQRSAMPVPGEAVQVPSVVLQPAEQAAVIAFAERAPRLTPERRAELADLVAPLTGTRGSAGVAQLDGIANWLLGRR